MEFLTQFLAHFTDLGKHAMFIWLSWGAVFVALVAMAISSRASVTRRANQVAELKSKMSEANKPEGDR